MEKVRSWCGQPLDRGRLKNRTELKCQVHIGEKGRAWPGWTTSRCGQDSPWMSQSEWQTTGINGESTSMMWPTLGSRAAKEQNSSVSFQWQENWMPVNWSYVGVAYDYRCCGCRESAGVTDCSTTPGWCCLSHWWAAAVSNLLFCNVEQCFSENLQCILVWKCQTITLLLLLSLTCIHPVTHEETVILEENVV